MYTLRTRKCFLPLIYIFDWYKLIIPFYSREKGTLHEPNRKCERERKRERGGRATVAYLRQSPETSESPGMDSNQRPDRRGNLFCCCRGLSAALARWLLGHALNRRLLPMLMLTSLPISLSPAKCFQVNHS